MPKLTFNGKTIQMGGSSIIIPTTPPSPTDQLFYIQGGMNDVYANGAFEFVDTDKVIVGGYFSNYRYTPVNNIVKINNDGSIDDGFTIGTGFNSSSSGIFDIQKQTDGKLIVVGEFSDYNGNSCGNICRLNSDGTFDSSFNSGGTGFGNENSGMRTVQIQTDGKILVGGTDTSYNGNPFYGLIRLNSDGSVDNGFTIGTGFNKSVKVIKLLSSGKVLVGGNFTDYNGFSINRLILLNSDGTRDTGFAIGSGFGLDNYSGISTLGIQSDGKIICGGGFTNYNGNTVGLICRLNSDGTFDSSFNSGGTGFAQWDTPRSLAIQTDNKIVVGGWFSAYNEQDYFGLVRLNSDGTIDSSFNGGISGFDSASIEVVAIAPDDKILLYGGFTSYNNEPYKNILRLNADGTSNTSSEYSTDKFTLKVNTQNGLSITLPHLSGYVHDYVVDWGDGNSNSVTSWDDTGATHTYSSNSEYIVKIDGTCETLYFDNGNTYANRIWGILGWGNVGIKEVKFESCRITSLPTDTYSGLTLVTNFSNTFKNCIYLTNISSGLFDFCTGVTDFSGTFDGCYQIPSIPSGLFDNCPNVTDFSYTFNNLYQQLTSIPSGLFDNCPNVTDFVRTFYNCNKLVSASPDLWNRFPEPDGTDCFKLCSNLTNWSVIPTTWGGPYVDTSLVLTIETTSSNQSITIPHLSGYTHDYTINYGDGTIIPITSWNDTGCTHIYSTVGTHQIKISGTCETFYVNNSGTILNTITSITQWGDNGLKIINFDGCSNLTSIASDSSGLADIIDFDNTFQNCTSLTTIPTGLFDNNTGVTSFSYTFDSCQITSIPSGLFDNNTSVTSFEGTFNNTPITSIPSGLFDNNTSVTDFTYTFTDCTSLTGVAPNLWNRAPEPSGTSCFSGCTDLVNYEFIPVSWGGLGNDAKFVLQITTTTPNQSITMGHAGGYSYDYIIDYGDGSPFGSVTSYTDPDCTHVYTDIGTYEIKIDGLCETIYGSYANLQVALTKISNWGFVGLKIANFTDAHSLTTIDNNGKGLYQLTTVNEMFRNCTSLTGITSGLFDYCTNITGFYSTFYGCSNLETIPSDLFDNCPQALSFNNIFLGCSSLTTIPSGLFDNCINTTDFTGTFSGCESLTSIPIGLFDNCTDANDFGQCFYYCPSLTGNAPDLWNRVPEPVGSSCFFDCTGLTNWEVIPLNWGGPYDPDSLQLEITTTSSSNSITLNQTNGYTYNYTVDYGDNTGIKTVTSYNDADRIHTYSVAGTYTIKIWGICEALQINSLYLTKILQWGNISAKLLGFGESNLTTIEATDSEGLSSLESIDSMFYACMELTTIPSGMFDFCTGVTSLNNTFYDTYKLTSIPSGLFDNLTEVTSFSGTFDMYNYGTNPGLTSIPTDLFKYNTKATNFNRTFYRNYLSSIPTGLFDYCTGATDFTSTFGSNTGITSIPAGLFSGLTNVSTFESTFYSCVGLTSIPTGLFDSCTGVTNFSYTFSDCTSLTGNAPDLWNRDPEPTGTGCFSNDTGLTNYASIPTTWGGPV